MSVLQKRSLFAAATTLTVWAFVQPPLLAQTTDANAVTAKSAMEELSRQLGVPPKASAAAAHQKADADMTKALSSPPTEADRKAATAMSK